MDITPQPLTRDAFAPFGDVIDIPDGSKGDEEFVAVKPFTIHIP